MPRPRLVLGARGQVSDHHLHCLQLLVLGRDGAHLVGDLVACHGNVLAFNVRDVHEDVGPSVRRGDESVAFGAAEALADPFVDGSLRGSHRGRKRPGAAGGQRAGDEVPPHGGRGALPGPAALGQMEGAGRGGRGGGLLRGG